MEITFWGDKLMNQMYRQTAVRLKPASICLLQWIKNMNGDHTEKCMEKSSFLDTQSKNEKIQWTWGIT